MVDFTVFQGIVSQILDPIVEFLQHFAFIGEITHVVKLDIVVSEVELNRRIVSYGI